MKKHINDHDVEDILERIDDAVEHRLCTDNIKTYRVCFLSFRKLSEKKNNVLQVQTAGIRLIFSVLTTFTPSTLACQQMLADIRPRDTAILIDLHWLRVPQRIQYKLSMLMYRCLNGAAPRYLTKLATPVGSTVRRRLRSPSSTDLVVPATRRSTIGDRRCWPESMEQSTSCCPLLCHIQHLEKDLKSHLFGLSFSL